MKAVDQAGFLTDARLKFFSVERVIFLADASAVKASGYADTLTGAQRSLVSLRALGVDAEMGNLRDRTCGAGNGEGLSLHENVEAASLGLAEVSYSVLGGPTELTFARVGCPRRIVVHDWDVEEEYHEEDDHERVDDVEVRDDTVSEASHGVLALLKEEIEERLVRATLSIILRQLQV